MTVSGGVEMWAQYIAAARADAATLARHADKAVGARDLAGAAFRIGLSSLLVGAEDVGRLALAIERTVEGERSPHLENGVAVLVAAIEQLANPDRSGARVEGLDLEGARRALEGRHGAASPSPVTARSSTRPPPPPPRAAPDRAAPTPATEEREPKPGFVWAPTVDDDMIDLFFDEATERVEGVSQKLLAIERAAGDAELLRDLFRDLHTVKGSSAMVGLEPVNRLAHAAEDLVGQLRDGTRAVDSSVVDALLAALDALRAMLDEARSRAPISVDAARVLQALRNPGAAPALPPSAPHQPAAQPVKVGASAPAAEEHAPHGAAHAARQTIRVDFDKLDRLLNLVGELVLGRDGLRSAFGALASITTELSADRGFARRLAASGLSKRMAAPRTTSGRGLNDRSTLLDFAEDLGRIERVLGSIAGDLDASTGYLDSISSELREQVMRLRMVPIGGIFRKHQRTVRDLCQTLGKSARLEIEGEDTELDKLLVEALDEPLLHLVRNAVDHGVEDPKSRERAGKPAEAVLRLEASHRGNQVVIRVTDDGRGMDAARLAEKAIERGLVSQPEVAAMDTRAMLDLIFKPGFSTAAKVTDVSGRGVGMDVVRQTIVTKLKGTIDIDSAPGRGSTFTLRLPLTLAIIQVILARVSGEVFAIPLDSVERTLVVQPSEVAMIGDREALVVEGRSVPLVRLARALELDGTDSDEALHVVLTESSGALYALSCDALLAKREIVIKSLGQLLSAVPCASGATLLGDRCALILDVPAVIQRALSRPVGARAVKRARGPGRRGSLLVVDDSDTVRESLRRLFTDAGFEVTTAEDGAIGLELCKQQSFDLVSTDVMMPHMDGYELTRALRAMSSYRDTPIVMVTSRGERIDRVRGFDAGVDDYITKPHDRQELLRAVERLLAGHHGHGPAHPQSSPHAEEEPDR